MKIQYLQKNFRASSLHIIDTANDIIKEYQAQGFSLTLRQLYYQFVARDLIENTQKEYKKLGNIINNGRLAGLVDWSAIEDRTRFVRKTTTWNNPKEIIGACVHSFKLDMWETQEHRVEVWIEKDALIGVIENICNKYQVPHFSCRGYVSQSETFVAGQRMAEHFSNGQVPIILHLGDHDPSGIDMTRDVEERISMFAENSVEIRRLALNIKQVKKFKPPPNPAKMTDTRAGEYIREFGKSSWELDALEPSYISKIIEDNITGLIDDDAWEAQAELEVEYKNELEEIADNLEG